MPAMLGHNKKLKIRVDFQAYLPKANYEPPLLSIY